MDQLDGIVAEDSQSWRRSVDSQMPDLRPFADQSMFVVSGTPGQPNRSWAGLAGTVVVVVVGVIVAVLIDRHQPDGLPRTSSPVGGFGASVATREPPPCNSSQSGFGLSIGPSATGAATPLAAAHVFEVSGQVHGYGTPASNWIISASNAHHATLRSGPVTLQAQKDRRGWFVVQGEKGTHC